MRTARHLIVAATLFGAIAAVPATAKPAPAAVIAAALASPSRPAADSARDADRKAGALIALAGIKPGDTVADLVPGGGYFTRIFSALTGAKGKVYAVLPAEMAAGNPKQGERLAALAAEPALTNVTAVTTPSDVIALPAPVDVAWTTENYHDIYGYYGADKAAAFAKAVFKALKPGGVFLVSDHVALTGTSATAPTTLHRIDPATVKAQLVAAGFVIEAESGLLKNPADDHTLKVFDPLIRGKTDQFVFKARKPRR